MFDQKSVLFFFQKQPGQEDEEEVDAAAEQQHRLGLLNVVLDLRVVVKDEANGLAEPKRGIGQPDNEKRQHAPDDEDGKKDAPNQKNTLVLFRHRAQDVGVDDGVVNAADDLKQAQAKDDD